MAGDPTRREIERRDRKEARRRRKAGDRMVDGVIVVRGPLRRADRGRDQADVQTNGRV